jgi:hypothetical protein
LLLLLLLLLLLRIEELTSQRASSQTIKHPQNSNYGFYCLLLGGGSCQ